MPITAYVSQLRETYWNASTSFREPSRISIESISTENAEIKLQFFFCSWLCFQLGLVEEANQTVSHSLSVTNLWGLFLK
jgi:hypothetical protein